MITEALFRGSYHAPYDPVDNSVLNPWFSRIYQFYSTSSKIVRLPFVQWPYSPFGCLGGPKFVLWNGSTTYTITINDWLGYTLVTLPVASSTTYAYTFFLTVNTTPNGGWKILKRRLYDVG